MDDYYDIVVERVRHLRDDFPNEPVDLGDLLILFACAHYSGWNGDLDSITTQSGNSTTLELAGLSRREIVSARRVKTYLDQTFQLEEDEYARMLESLLTTRIFDTENGLSQGSGGDPHNYGFHSPQYTRALVTYTDSLKNERTPLEWFLGIMKNSE